MLPFISVNYSLAFLPSLFKRCLIILTKLRFQTLSDIALNTNYTKMVLTDIKGGDPVSTPDCASFTGGRKAPFYHERNF